MSPILRNMTPRHLNQWLYLLFVSLILAACSTTPANKAQAPKQDETYVLQSVRYMHAGKLDEALASIQQALEVNPKSADAYTVAGLIYNKNNQPEQAQRYLQRALSIDPNHSAAQTNYASFLCKHDKPFEAEKIFLAAATNNKNPQTEVAYTNAGLCVMGIPDTIKASNYFSKALQINPKSPVPLYQLAKIQYSSYQYKKAYQFLQAYENIARPTPKTLLLGARIGEAMQNPQLAYQYRNLLTQQFPNSAEAKQITAVTPSNLRQQPAAYDLHDYNPEDTAY